MRFPRFDFFIDEQGTAPSIIYASGSPALSASPRLYKYLWQIFSRQSVHEGNAFFEHAPFVCTAHMLALGETCVVYGMSRPREGEDMPWDRTHPRWRDARCAPSWADDPDPLTVGGHK